MRILLAASLLLGGCAVAPVIAALPGALAGRAVSFFEGRDASLAVDMQRSLAAVQQGLEQMSLHANVLEPVAGGYLIEFGNGQLDGDVQLLRQTDRLTTVTVKAHRGLGHEESVESAIVKQLTVAADQTAEDAKFDFDGYDKVYRKPDKSSTELGWFLPGQKLNVSSSRPAGWLKIRLPSGKQGYIKGFVEKGDV